MLKNLYLSEKLSPNSILSNVHLNLRSPAKKSYLHGVLLWPTANKKDWTDEYLILTSKDSITQIRGLTIFFFFYLCTCHTLYAKAVY